MKLAPVDNSLIYTQNIKISLSKHFILAWLFLLFLTANYFDICAITYIELINGYYGNHIRVATELLYKGKPVDVP